jgi:6-phosphogluconolactonase (cycloisomerase 2 family)
MVSRRASRTIALALALFAPAASAFAQAAEPMVFVANNGNLEGSVTSYRLGPANEPVFLSKTIIETRSSSGGGTNASQAALSPDGRFLVVSHATAQTDFEQLTILRVHPDGTTSIARIQQTPDSPLGVAWLNNTRLAVTITKVSGPNYVILYAFDPVNITLTEVDREYAGAFCYDLAVHPNGRYLYANDNGSSLNIRVFELNTAGTLDLIQTVPVAPRYAIGLGISNAGDRLYAGGGISDGRNKILAFEIGCDGLLTPLLNQPYISPGNSPKQGIASWDDSIVFVGHGTDSTVRSFLVDPATGDLTYAGYSFSTGIQGSLGDIDQTRGLLFLLDKDVAIDGVSGLYSYTIHPDGNFTRNGSLVSSQGPRPEFLAVWWPCSADLNGDRAADFNDLLEFLNLYINGNLRVDLNRDCTVDFNDLLEYLNLFNAGC